MKKLWIAIVLLAVAAFLLVLLSGGQPASTSIGSSTRPTPAADRHAHESFAQSQQREFAATGRVPAYYQTPPDANTLPPTLSPELFKGSERLAYQAAKEIPHVLAQLPCYCHCDRGHGHKSLHSCFESEHGENCGICIAEALTAHNLTKRGVSVGEIRKQIIAAYGQRQN